MPRLPQVTVREQISFLNPQGFVEGRQSGSHLALWHATRKTSVTILYDVLAELGYGLAPRARPQRAEAFTYKHERWLATLPAPATATLKALAGQFARSGTDGLESPQVFDTPDVTRAGGLPALKAFGQPADILRQTKGRLFAA